MLHARTRTRALPPLFGLLVVGALLSACAVAPSTGGATGDVIRDTEVADDARPDESADDTEAARELPQPDCRDTVQFGGYIGDFGDDDVTGFLHPELLPEGALERAGCLMTSTPAGVGYTHELLWFFHADRELYTELVGHAEQAGLDPVSWQDTNRSGVTWSASEIWEKPSDPAKYDGYEYHFLQSNHEVDQEVIRDYVWEGSFLAYVEQSHPKTDTAGYVSGYGPVIFFGWISEN